MVRAVLLILLLSFSPALADEGLPARMEAALVDAARPALPADAELSVVSMTAVRGYVSELRVERFDTRSGYFSAVVGNGNVERTITGRASVLVPVLTVARFVREGEPVDDAAMSTTLVPMSRLPASPLRLSGRGEGLEFRRSLPAGSPLSADDVGPKTLIQRSDPVTLSFQSAHLRLTAKGQAMGAGGEGDVIAVMPDGGNQIIKGVVSAPGLVAVGGTY